MQIRTESSSFLFGSLHLQAEAHRVVLVTFNPYRYVVISLQCWVRCSFQGCRHGLWQCSVTQGQNPSPQPEHAGFRRVSQDLDLLFLSNALQICPGISVVQHMYKCILEVWLQECSANLWLPPICFSYPHDLGNPDLPVFWKPWKWHLVRLNMTDKSVLFSLPLGLYHFTLRNLMWVTTPDSWAVLLFYYPMLKAEERGPEASPAPFPSLAARKSKS